MTLPWDALADAYERLAHAERHGGPGEVASVRAEVDLAREHLASIGSLLVLMALGDGSQVVRNKLGAVLSEMSLPAWKRATSAARRATYAVEEVDLLRQRVAELEERVARLTPGIGEPGR